MSTSDAAKQLGVTHSHLNGRSSIVCTFHLMISLGRTARLWPREYVDSFAVYTRHKNHVSISRTAKDFVAHREVLQLFDRVQQSFAERLNAREVFTGIEVAELFCVASSTVAGWRIANILSPLEGRPTPRGGRGRPQEYVYSRAELQRISKWHLPKI